MQPSFNLHTVRRVTPCLGRTCGLETTADARGAEVAFCRPIELAGQQSALSWRLRASMSLTRPQFRQGRRGREALSETYARFSEGFDTADLKTAERLLAALS
jgi:predicted ATPase